MSVPSVPTVPPSATPFTASALMPGTLRKRVGLVNAIGGGVGLLALVATYGVAEQLVTDQEAAETGTLVHHDIGVWLLQAPVSLVMALILMGAAAGFVGSIIQQSIIFAARAGAGTLETGFFWWYVLRPIWSALLGAIAVLAVNASLISIGDQSTSNAGVTVLVTVGCLAGLFTDKMLDKLQTLLGATDPHKPATAQ